MEQGLEIATTGGGCFWFLGARFQQFEGGRAMEARHAGGDFSLLRHSEAQRAVAEYVIRELEAGHAYDARIVTQIEPEQPYWRAEASHQNYYQEHPAQGYCAFVISPKLVKFRRDFSHHVRR